MLVARSGRATALFIIMQCCSLFNKWLTPTRHLDITSSLGTLLYTFSWLLFLDFSYITQETAQSAVGARGVSMMIVVWMVDWSMRMVQHCRYTTTPRRNLTANPNKSFFHPSLHNMKLSSIPSLIKVPLYDISWAGKLCIALGTLTQNDPTTWIFLVKVFIFFFQ